MTKTEQCPLCKNSYQETCGGSNKHGIYTYQCQACGHYDIDQYAKTHIMESGSRKNDLYIISAVTRDYYERNKKNLEITEGMIIEDAKFQAEFFSKSPKSVLDKTSLLLQYIARNSNEKPSTPVSVRPEIDYPIAFCKDKDELKFYIHHLTEKKLIVSKRLDFSSGYTGEPKYELSLTVDGWIEVEKLKTPNLDSKQAFVAMWFDPTMEEPFEKGILPLGEENETGFKMLRIDQKHFNDKICDHIIADIKQSRFMVADCTELRPAVFFEAGYAMGLGLPVIFTCKEGTDIKKCFDTDHYNHIVWKDAEDLKNKLRDRILATIGKTH
jgi:hypothetical protein